MPSLDSGPIDKSGAAIQDMFAGVAPRYDRLNRLLSLRRDVAWRKASAEALDLPSGARVLDLCCGTGDQALALGRRRLHVTAADFCLPMLALAEAKYRGVDSDARPEGLAADTLALPFADSTFEGVSVSFGLRNLADLDRGLSEIWRVLVPGGRVAFLEFAVPRRRLLRALYLAYFTRILPWIGRRFSSSRSAYTYLPASVLAFPQRDGMLERLDRAGLAAGRWRDLTAGIVCLYTATKSPKTPEENE